DTAGGDGAGGAVPVHLAHLVIDRCRWADLRAPAGHQAKFGVVLQGGGTGPEPVGLDPAIAVDELHKIKLSALQQRLEPGIAGAGAGEWAVAVQLDHCNAKAAGKGNAVVARSAVNINDPLAQGHQRAQAGPEPVAFVAADGYRTKCRFAHDSPGLMLRRS